MNSILSIPGYPPRGLNVSERQHWAIRRKERDWWRSEVYKAWLVAGRPYFKHPLVTVRMYFKMHRRRDPDNLTASCKALLDGLKGHAFKDDDGRTIALAVEDHVDAKEPRVEIEMEERDG